MTDILLVPFMAIYLFIITLLFIYGLNFFYLTYVTWSKRHSRLESITLAVLPHVTVQLPIFNELYVAERLINAVAALDYPTALLEIQVLDDSTDETVAVVRSAVERLYTRGTNIVCLHRTHREGFKAGALAEGVARAHGEFLAIFDADFVPPSDFLKRTLPYFREPSVAFIQTRWGHLNRNYSLLTCLQSFIIDAHFMVEQFARCHAGYWFNFSGTAGIWRRSALEDAGGWNADTLTEDLDLSYRAFLRGWRAVYLRDVEVPAELPVNFMAYRRQQHRWARGSLECALKLTPLVWQAPISLGQKLEATLHLSGYCIHLLMCALILLYPIMLALSPRYSQTLGLFGVALIFNLSTFAPMILSAVAQRQIGREWWRVLPMIMLATVLGAGMTLNTVRAALQIPLRRASIFERTPKFGIAHKKQDWIRRRYQIHFDAIVFFEVAFAILNIGTIFFAVQASNWIIAFYAALFCLGMLFASGLTIAQTVALHRHQPCPIASGVATSVTAQ